MFMRSGDTIKRAFEVAPELVDELNIRCKQRRLKQKDALDQAIRAWLGLPLIGFATDNLALHHRLEYILRFGTPRDTEAISTLIDWSFAAVSGYAPPTPDNFPSPAEIITQQANSEEERYFIRQLIHHLRERSQVWQAIADLLRMNPYGVLANVASVDHGAAEGSR